MVHHVSITSVAMGHIMPALPMLQFGTSCSCYLTPIGCGFHCVHVRRGGPVGNTVRGGILLLCTPTATVTTRIVRVSIAVCNEYACVHIHTYICMYMYIHIYVCICTYIHILKGSNNRCRSVPPSYGWTDMPYCG